jgi:hypothetical protein
MRTRWTSSKEVLSWNLNTSDRQRLARSGAARQLYVLPGGMQVCTAGCIVYVHLAEMLLSVPLCNILLALLVQFTYM